MTLFKFKSHHIISKIFKISNLLLNLNNINTRIILYIHHFGKNYLKPPFKLKSLKIHSNLKKYPNNSN